jgi:hypothetical protein
VGFAVDEVELGQIFLEFFRFPCHYHSTGIHTHISSGGWKISPMEDAVQRHSLTPSTWTTLTYMHTKHGVYMNVTLTPRRDSLRSWVAPTNSLHIVKFKVSGLSWRWRQYVPEKRWYLPTSPYTTLLRRKRRSAK